MSTTENSSSTPSNAPYSAPPPSASNKPLTYLLYALLIGLVGLLGYRAIKLKNEKAAAAKAETEYQQLLTETGYQADDTTSGVSSPTTASTTTTTAADSKPLNLTEPNAANGIAATAGKAVSETAKKTEKAVESATKTAIKTTSKSVKTDTDDEELATSTSSKIRSGVDKKRPVTYAAPKGGAASKPPFVVIAASFSSKAGATKVMESLVKKGFENAEVTNKFRNGKYWYVIADRTKTEADAKKSQVEVAKIKDCEKAYVSKIK